MGREYFPQTHTAKNKKKTLIGILFVTFIIELDVVRDRFKCRELKRRAQTKQPLSRRKYLDWRGKYVYLPLKSMNFRLLAGTFRLFSEFLWPNI